MKKFISLLILLIQSQFISGNNFGVGATIAEEVVINWRTPSGQFVFENGHESSHPWSSYLSIDLFYKIKIFTIKTGVNFISEEIKGGRYNDNIGCYKCLSDKFTLKSDFILIPIGCEIQFHDKPNSAFINFVSNVSYVYHSSKTIYGTYMRSELQSTKTSFNRLSFTFGFGYTFHLFEKIYLVPGINYQVLSFIQNEILGETIKTSKLNGGISLRKFF
jgi:hypothetical protein